MCQCWSMNFKFLTQNFQICTPEACNLRFHTLTQFIDWPRVVLYFSLHSFIFSAYLFSIILQKTLRRRSVCPIVSGYVIYCVFHQHKGINTQNMYIGSVSQIDLSPITNRGQSTIFRCNTKIFQHRNIMVTYQLKIQNRKVQQYVL